MKTAREFLKSDESAEFKQHRRLMCDCCGGDLHYIGRLGSLDWSRCRNCGSEQAQAADDFQQMDSMEASDVDY